MRPTSPPIDDGPTHTLRLRYAGDIRLPSGSTGPAPVTLYDARGRVLAVMSAAKFRATHGDPSMRRWPLPRHEAPTPHDRVH